MVSGAALLDVNVLLALGLQQHEFHSAAIAWFDARSYGRWATCPMTQCGFVRISTHLQKVPNAAGVAAAVEALRDLCAERHHVFWPDDYSVSDETLFSQLSGHRQVTDAYLLALARRHQGRIATFDRGFVTLARAAAMPASSVILIPA